MCSDEQLGFLYDLALSAPDGLALEAGVAKGGSIAAWSAARIGRGRIVAVDNWMPMPKWGPQAKRRLAFDIHMARYGIPVEMLECDSWDAPAKLGEPIAFGFIDACHGDEGISRDVPAYTSAMMPGGILVFHDYGTWKCPAVKMRIDEWNAVHQWQVIAIVKATIALRCPL